MDGWWMQNKHTVLFDLNAGINGLIIASARKVKNIYLSILFLQGLQ